MILRQEVGASHYTNDGMVLDLDTELRFLDTPLVFIPPLVSGFNK